MTPAGATLPRLRDKWLACWKDDARRRCANPESGLSGLRTLRLNVPGEAGLAVTGVRPKLRSVAFFATWGCVVSGFREADASSNLPF